jgi:uncharacterized membrane protein YkvA (DUF1232 family)
LANTEFIYDLIHAMKNNIMWDDGSTIGVSLSYGVSSIPTVSPDFIPITGYDDSVAPFILYSFITRTESDEQYYFYTDTMRFYVYDTSIDRMWAISRAIKEFLNVGDDVESIKSQIPSDSRYRIVYSKLFSSLTMPPIERDGFVSTVNEFRVKYVLL